MKNFFEENIRYLLTKKDTSTNELESKLSVTLDGSKIGIQDLLKVADFFEVSVDRLLKNDLEKTFKKNGEIKLLILDVDGVLTNGGMYFTEKGDEIKQFNTKDGRGIISFKKNGGTIGIISSGFKREIIEQRSEMLGIQKVYVGQEKKEDVLQNWMKEINITWDQVAFVGDDINGLNVMKKVGLSACPNDAVDEIKSISDIVLKRDGGRGCVREFIGNYLVEVTL